MTDDVFGLPASILVGQALSRRHTIKAILLGTIGLRLRHVPDRGSPDRRTVLGGDHDGLIAKLDELTRWLTARAADAPDSFTHLVALRQAERAARFHLAHGLERSGSHPARRGPE